jgi:hypothetical protein
MSTTKKHTPVKKVTPAKENFPAVKIIPAVKQDPIPEVHRTQEQPKIIIPVPVPGINRSM